MQILDLKQLQYYDGKIKNYISTSYAPLQSPSFTGTPTSVTPSAEDSSTKIATTKYVQTELKTAKVASAGEFISAQTVELTGDITGSASSKSGWSISTTLSNTGVNANTYGPLADASPAHSGSFTVPKFTVDAKGRITSAGNITVTLPSANSLDTKVAQTAADSNDAGKYPILTKNESSTSTTTDTSKFAAEITIQPSTGSIEATKFIGSFKGNASSADSVPWSGVDGKPSTFTPSAHNQASNTINAMTGYSKPSSTSAIGTSDTLNAAIGKLEKALDGKANTGTTLSNYGIVDAKIESGIITLGSSTITPLTSNSSLNAAKLTGTASVNTSGKATTAGTADKTANSLLLKVKSGSTEGTDLYTFNGSGAKTLDIKQGSNVTLTAAEGSLTIAAKDTVYTHPTTSGNKHIPSGGSSGQFLGWDSDGTAKWVSNPNSDTKNTAGSTDTSSKIFLVGATSQAANPQTYSHDTAYVGTDGCLYSGGAKVLTAHQTLPTLSYTESGSGNAITGISVSNHAITATKGATYITSSGSITGNAGTATKFASSQSVALTGAITGTASSQAGWSISTIWRSCMVGQSGSTTTNPWYKVATFAVANANDDIIATFLVEDTYSSHKQGILKVHVRTDGSKIISSTASDLIWLSHTGFTLADFVLVCPTAASSTVELWTKIATGYMYRRFTVLSEGSRSSSSIRWTLLNASSAGQAASITTTGTQIASTLAGQAASCTGNAATATKLGTARTINVQDSSATNTGTAASFDGSANVTIKLPATIKASITGDCSGSSGSCTGNAATATKLANARSLWGNNFDGSAAITGTINGTPSIEFKPTAANSNNGGYLDFHYNQSTADYTSRIIESASGTLSINNVTITTGKIVTATTFTGALSGNASTATKLATARTIGISGGATGTATSFDGSGNITIPVTALDVSKASAGTLAVARGGTGLTSLDTFVRTTGNQTIAGTKTFSAEIMVNKGDKPAAGALSHVFGVTYQNTGGTQTHTAHPISIIGNSNVDNAYNTGVRLGSLNGTTVVSAGESGGAFCSTLSKFDDENLYLNADGEVHVYVKCANDMATYAGPIKLSGSGNASGGTTSITATTFIGALTGNVTGNCSGSSGSCTGNAATATKLATARTINGVSFDGSANITVADSTKLPLAGGTMTGQITYKIGSITRGTAPSSSQYPWGIRMIDNASVALSGLYYEYLTDKTAKTHLMCYQGTTNANTWKSIGIGYNTSGNPYTWSITPGFGDNSTQIATTEFVYKNAAKHLAAATNIYVAKAATGNGSGSNTSNYMSLADLRNYLATVHMHSSTADLNGSYALTILFKAGDSFGNASFDAAKMPGIRNLVLNTSTGTASTTSNYSTNSPTFGNIAVTGDISVTIRNINCTGRISAQYGAYVAVDTYVGLSSLHASNWAYVNVAKNMVIDVCDAHTDYLFAATNSGILAMWPGATVTINFRQQCYYTRCLFMSSANGSIYVGYSSFKLTGTKPMMIWAGSGTLTGTSETAAGTAAKVVPLADGQTFTLETNATAKVRFTNDNTAANPTLNINSTGAKAIWWNGAAVAANMLAKNMTYDVKYDGTHYVIQNALKRLTNNDFGTFRSSGNYNQTYNSGSWNFDGYTVSYGTGIENGNWRGNHIGNIEQRITTGNNTYPILFSGTANATANTSTIPYFGSGVKINPSTSTVYATTFSGNVTGSSGSCTGNAKTATTLQTARKINGVSFNGSADITVADSTKLPLAGGTVTGATYFTTDYYRKDTGAVKGTAPSANRWQNGVRFIDNNNVAFGGIERGFLTDKTNRVNMIVYKGTTTDTSTNAQIGVGFDKDGNWFTYAPTPAAADNSTKIATTAWVRGRLHISTADPSGGTDGDIWFKYA